MSCLYDYKGKKLNEKELIEALSQDPDMIQKYGTPQEERASSDYTVEELEVFERKVKHLQESMNVEVIIDESVESSRVLASSDPRVKKAGKPVILINPNAIFKTTAIHEFAHIFIDSLPKGVNNPRFKAAYEELVGTPLYREVKALYPDLNHEQFQKELVVTAIGRKGSEIWDSAEKASNWETFKKWIFNYINRVLGLDQSQVESLAKEVLSSNEKTGLSDNLSDYVQEQRVDEDINKVESELDVIHKEALARVSNMYQIYKPQSRSERIKEQKKAAKFKTNFEKVSDMKKALEKFDEADKVLGLAKYVKWSTGEISSIEKRLNNALEEGTLDTDLIVRLSEWNAVFDLLPDISQLVESSDLKESKKKIFRKKIQNIYSKKEDVDAKLLNISRKTYAKIMSENDVQAVEEARQQYSAEWRDLGLNEPENEYVQKKLNENMDDIREKSYKKYLTRAVKSTSDISSAVGVLATEKNMKSQEIQVASKLIDSAELKSRTFSQSEASLFKAMQEKADSILGSNIKLSDKYKGMVEVSENGVSYFVSEYKADFMEKRSEMVNQANNVDIYSENFKDVEISKDKKYTVNGQTKPILIAGVKTFKVEGAHVKYTIKGNEYTITKEEAIAGSELIHWNIKNTKKAKVEGSWKTVPTDAWKNKEYEALSSEKKELLRFLSQKIEKADELTKGTNSLISHAASQKWMRLPAVMKTDAERISGGQGKSLLLHKLSEMTQIQKDEFDIEGAESNQDDSIKVFADVSNKEKLRVPIPFRAKLEEKEQSLDLFTITLMNLVQAKNYEQKKALESTMLVMTDVMANRYVPQKHGVKQLRVLHRFSKDVDVELHHSKARMPNDAKKMADMLENRIYNIKSKDAGEIAGMNVQKLASSWLKYSGSLALIGNLANSVVNYSMGSTSNFIEAMGGEHFTIKDLAKAKELYWKDIKGIVNDIGTNVDSSRTNLFFNMFDVAGKEGALSSNLEVDRFRTMMKTVSMRPIAKGGEHMVQAQVMYAVMNNIKITSPEGKFLDKDGKVVANKKDAASLHEVITFEKSSDGVVEMKLPDFVQSTTFTPNGGQHAILLETRNLIKKKIIDLHGNYDAELQSAAQREWWGKLLFFLRKWIEPGIYRRWRGLPDVFSKNKDLAAADKYFSNDLKSKQEGYYITAARFLTKVLPKAIKEMNFELLKGKDLSAHEKANLRRVLTEIGMIALMITCYSILGGGDSDDDDTLLARYLLRRQVSELTFFLWPPEAYKIASTPTASVGMAKRFFQFIMQLGNPMEKYEQGKDKDRLKLGVKGLKMLPVFSQTEKDIEQSLRFLNNMSN